jgi:hypothetical protein
MLNKKIDQYTYCKKTPQIQMLFIKYSFLNLLFNYSQKAESTLKTNGSQLVSKVRSF